MNPRLLLLVIVGVLLPAVEAPALGSDFGRPINQGELTSSQKRRLDQIRSLLTTPGHVQVVQINPTLLRQRSRVIVPLPDRSAVTVETNSKNISNEAVFSIFGRILGHPEGTAVIAVNRNYVTASLQTDTGLYRIQPLGGDAHAVFKVERFRDD